MTKERSSAPDGEMAAELRGAVAVLRLRRPHVLNAMTPAMVGAIREAVERFGGMEAVRGLVVTGEGRGFCAGADIRFESEATEEEFGDFIDGIQDLTRALRSSDIYVVAALNGVAVGGGFELALACDARVAAPGTPVGFPEIKLGLTVTGGVVHTLPRLVGPSRALELLVSGRSLPAEEALVLGLVDRISGDPVAEAIRLAAVAEQAPPGLIKLVKLQLHTGAEATMEEALRAEKSTIVDAFRRPAARERLREFLSRRRSRDSNAGDAGGAG